MTQRSRAGAFLAFLLLVGILGWAGLGLIAAIFAYSIARAYHFRNNFIPKHSFINPLRVPFVLDRGEAVLLGHTKAPPLCRTQGQTLE